MTVIDREKAPAAPPSSWPFTLNDPVRAVHFAMEPDCPYGGSGCPGETTARKMISAYKAWAAVHPHASQS